MNKSKKFNQSGVGAVVLLIILSLIAGSVVVLKKTALKPTPTAVPVNPVNPPESATGKVAALSFATDPLSTVPGQNFDLVIRVKPNGKEFHAFELYAKYDPANTGFQIQGDLSKNISSPYPLIISKVDPDSGLISIVGTRTGSAFAGSEEQEIARVKMLRKSGSAGQMSFNWEDKSKLGNKIPLQKSGGTF